MLIYGKRMSVCLPLFMAWYRYLFIDQALNATNSLKASMVLKSSIDDFAGVLAVSKVGGGVISLVEWAINVWLLGGAVVWCLVSLEWSGQCFGGARSRRVLVLYCISHDDSSGHKVVSSTRWSLWWIFLFAQFFLQAAVRIASRVPHFGTNVTCHLHWF